MLQSKMIRSFRFASAKSMRMCICCRKKFLQQSLLRLCIQEGNVDIFSGFGRSFYLCYECSLNPKAGDKMVKIKKLDTQSKEKIKEIVALWESQLKNLQQN